jgi:anti-sigma B factor antagonist
LPDDFDTELSTSLDPSGEQPILRVRGEIDLFSATDFRTALDEAVGLTGHVMVDLARVDFIDSTGLRVLLETRRRIEPDGGTIALTLDPSGPVARLLDLAGVDGMFPRHEPPAEQG